MKISLKQLRIFVAIVQMKQLGLAAEHCHVTQSAASMALTELESRLKTPLFNRVGKRLVLNEVGHTQLPKAIEILDRVTEFENLTSPSLHQGQLRIGTSKTVGTYILPKIMAQFLKKYPGILLNYQLGNSETTMDGVVNNQFDVGFIEAPLQHPDINVLPFKKDRLIMFVNAAHPLAKKRKLSWHDLQSYQWVLRESGSGTREIFLNAIQQFISTLDIALELNDTTAIKEFVQQSMTIACLGESAILQELRSKSLIELKLPDFKIERNLSLIVRKDKYHSDLFKKFSKLCQA